MNSIAHTPTAPTTVVITGGAGGIGRAIARRIADVEQVAILDLDPEAVDATVREIGPSARGYACDVTDSEAVATAARHISAELGPPRAVVAAAGWARRGDFLDTTRDLHLQTLAVNFTGVLNVTASFAPTLLSGHAHPRLVFVSSDAARAGVRDLAVYAAAKAAVNGFARSFALEVARRGLTVNVVSAGSTDAPMLTQAYSQEEIEKRIRANPLGRLAAPEDVASAVAFLLGPDSAYVTGQIISVNGGAFRPC